MIEKVLNISMGQGQAKLCSDHKGRQSAGRWVASSAAKSRTEITAAQMEEAGEESDSQRLSRAEKAHALTCWGATWGVSGFGFGPRRMADIFKVHNLLFSIIAQAVRVHVEN